MAKVELKQPIVAEISELLDGAATAVVVDYRGHVRSIEIPPCYKALRRF